jgi:hypothetical protein
VDLHVVTVDDASVSTDAGPVSADEPSSQVTTDDVEDDREDEEEQTDTAADSAEAASEAVETETTTRSPSVTPTATIEFLATEGTVGVKGFEAGTLSVGDSWTAVEDSERQATASRGPGLGGVGAVAAIVVAVVALRRRRGRGE